MEVLTDKGACQDQLKIGGASYRYIIVPFHECIPMTRKKCLESLPQWLVIDVSIVMGEKLISYPSNFL